MRRAERLFPRPTDEELWARLEKLDQWFGEASDAGARESIAVQHEALRWVLGLTPHPGPVM